MDDAGNFVVAWMSNLQDGSDWGIYAQRYDASGAAQGTEFRINETTTGKQWYPELAMDASGNFVAVWENNPSGNSEIYARRYDASGTPLAGEFQVNSYTTSHQKFATAAMDDAGNFVVVWQSFEQDGDKYGVYAQRYDAAGVAQGGEFQVSTFTIGDQQRASVAMDSDGDFVVVWHSWLQDGDGYGVYGQRYNAAGVAQGGEFLVNTEITGKQRDPAVAMDAAGNFVVTWSSDLQDGSGWGIYAQEYSASGAPVGSEYRVNTTTASDQKQSGVAMDSAGDFVVVWSGNGPGDTSGVFGQRYDACSVCPTIVLPGGPVNYAEGDPATLIDAAATVSDPDSLDFDTGTLTVDFTSRRRLLRGRLCRRPARSGSRNA